LELTPVVLEGASDGGRGRMETEGTRKKFLVFFRLINVRQPASYSLRSSASTVLLFPKGKMLSTFGDRAFSMAAPNFGIRFQQSCATHLLKLAFDIWDYL